MCSAGVLVCVCGAEESILEEPSYQQTDISG